ncbi:thiamine biosynthesis protein (Thi-4) [Fimicolochytrium jonesii]|uniref:thiamine biosynthesis protein (Thi-4) n=1 Tax=Fimicolochytrium jonesii TaxID=1396493 RepID=UPI0022FEA52A|nr:thiamine biosynthesis protein (Thi-4) [Fimicolochytrium jonesii]KAI8825946.1 thiamine biosynthesis protein (Thi-4) [Fimicolochytrium jonesii]
MEDTTTSKRVPRALTVAGSDSGGGAGIQADLKTFNTLSVYGTSVLTALTAQNTVGVQGVQPVPASFILEQTKSVLEDIGCDAAKTGMLFDVETIETVAQIFKQYSITRLVVDPVMVSTSGARLLNENAVTALRSTLLPIAEVVTPNIPEAEALSGLKVTSLDDMKAAARALHALGPKYVLVKGGHLPMTKSGASILAGAKDAHVIDVLYDGREFVEFVHPFLDTKATHGTGCTLSAAITAGLAKNMDVPLAVKEAIEFVSKGLSTSFTIGHGAGPLNHFPSAPSPLTVSSNGPVKPKRSFVETLLATCPEEWRRYVEHPFVLGLADGTLPIQSFKHYIRQDYIFLKHYARANALAAYREHDMAQIVKAAQIVVHIGHECQMHVKFCEQWGITLPTLEATPEATPNLAYTRYVLEKGMSGDRLDLRVALAPCLLGYGEIGLRLANDPNTKREGNIYWPWIQNYAKEDFQAAVREGRELLESLFEEMVPEGNTKRIKQLCDTFRQATVLEEQFWESKWWCCEGSWCGLQYPEYNVAALRGFCC